MDKRAEFIKEQRAAVCFLEPADARLGRARKRTRLMTEQFRLDQRFGQRGTVHHHQRFTPAVGQVVKSFGDQLFAGSALADNEDGAGKRGSTTGPLDRVENGLGLADKLLSPIHSPEFSANAQLLAIFSDDLRGSCAQPVDFKGFVNLAHSLQGLWHSSKMWGHHV